MKIPLFIANIVSAIFLINLLVTSPSITGFAVFTSKTKMDLASPLGIAFIFILVTIALDVYFYFKTKH